mgnify:CR=1 FL=1
MKINKKGQFIGRGEVTALAILKDLFGLKAEYKTQVKFMIMKELGLKVFNAPIDASDALAIAICHLHQLKLEEL